MAAAFSVHMSIVTSLLGLMRGQFASELNLREGEVPTLLVRGAMRPLSMPPLDRGMLEQVCDEVLDAEERTALNRHARLTSPYMYERPGSECEQFLVEFEVAAAWSICFRLAEELDLQAPSPPVQADPSFSLDSTLRPREASTAPPNSETELPRMPSQLLVATQPEISDLFLSTGQAARIRRHGQLGPAPMRQIWTEEAILSLFESQLTAEHRHKLTTEGSVDLALAFRIRPGMTQRFRANLFRQVGGIALALRPIRRSPPRLNELAIPPLIGQLAQLRDGLVLLTGPTGSGKSTTLAAMIADLNENHSRHIITLEDPIEFVYPQRGCLIHQRELGRHVPAFDTGLRAALRENPDVIMVGEMRDHATISAALTAAETGHLVLSTLHAGDAAMAIDRMIDVFPAYQQPQIRLQLASSLRAVVTQTLVPTRADQGRVPAFEVMRMSTGVAACIREERCHMIRSQIQTGKAVGMCTLEASLAALLAEGRISKEAAMAHARDLELMRALVPH